MSVYVKFYIAFALVFAAVFGVLSASWSIALVSLSSSAVMFFVYRAIDRKQEGGFRNDDEGCGS